MWHVMGMRKSILAALVMAVLIAGCGGPSAYEPVPGVEVHHYEVDLQLDPEARAIEGRAALDVSFPDTLETLPLSFGRMTIDSVVVDGRRVESAHGRGRLRLEVLPGASTDTSRVEIAYRGRPSEGLYRGTHRGHEVVYSDGWPERVAGWLPGAHHPSDPATLGLRLTVPLGYEVVASGALARRDTLDGGVRSDFRLTTPAPTYSYAFTVGDYLAQADTARWEGRTWPVEYHLLPSDTARVEALRRTPEALALFSDLLGPYPFEAYAAAEVPFEHAGMENAAASFLQAGLLGQASTSTPGFYHPEAVAVHELAHQWFGNHLSLAEWRDLWLSEGMATYLTTLFYERADGEEAAHALRAEMVEDPTSWTGPLVPSEEVQPEDHLSTGLYNRGASVLHLLRLVVGNEAFFEALRALYQDHADRPLSTQAFQKAMEGHSGRDLEEFFNEWVYGQKLPALRTQWESEEATLRWQLEEESPWIDESRVLLEVRQGDERRYVPLRDGMVTLDTPVPRPDIRPVGVMLRVR